MEKFGLPKAEISTQIEAKAGIESTANFEGNESEILISRLRDPDISNQIAKIRLIRKKKFYDEIHRQNWVDWAPDGWEGKEKFKRGEETGTILNAEYFEEQQLLPEPTPESVLIELQTEVEREANVTEIDFTSNEPSSEVMPLNWTVPWSGKRPTIKQMSIIEAHERGHRIRSPRDYDLQTEAFRKGFDIGKVNFTEAHNEMMRKGMELWTEKPSDIGEPLSLEEARKNYLYEYLFSSVEIAERMSQLKNYFGFSGAEKFTKEHLQYAREHYVEDTDMDNSMTLFFEAITPETEDSFIEVINTMGI